MNANTLFGPLGQEYCLYFYFLSVFGFIIFAFVIISGFVMGFSKKRDASFYFQVMMGSLAYAIFYFQNRLLYSMCSGAMTISNTNNYSQ